MENENKMPVMVYEYTPFGKEVKNYESTFKIKWEIYKFICGKMVYDITINKTINAIIATFYLEQFKCDPNIFYQMVYCQEQMRIQIGLFSPINDLFSRFLQLINDFDMKFKSFDEKVITVDEGFCPINRNFQILKDFYFKFFSKLYTSKFERHRKFANNLFQMYLQPIVNEWITIHMSNNKEDLSDIFSVEELVHFSFLNNAISEKPKEYVCRNINENQIITVDKFTFESCIEHYGLNHNWKKNKFKKLDTFFTEVVDYLAYKLKQGCPTVYIEKTNNETTMFSIKTLEFEDFYRRFV